MARLVVSFTLPYIAGDQSRQNFQDKGKMCYVRTLYQHGHNRRINAPFWRYDFAKSAPALEYCAKPE
jgi:hypothetical protein